MVSIMRVWAGCFMLFRNGMDSHFKVVAEVMVDYVGRGRQVSLEYYVGFGLDEGILA
jgi:hypothetical protein